MVLKDYLKTTWLYERLRILFMWPKRMAIKRKFFYMTYQKNWMIDPCSEKRQKYWMKCGVKSDGHFRVGADVYFDAQNGHLLTIDDGVWISSRCTILCHKRDITTYGEGVDYYSLPYDLRPVHICRDVHIGMGSMILPGVTIGEGAIIGAGSLVTKDVPAWCVVAGHPAKVIRELPRRESY